MRIQLHRAHPASFGEYVGRSVSPQLNQVMRCPQIMAEGKGALYTDLSAAQYQLYFSATASVRSGHDLVSGTAGTYAVPRVFSEAMPRITNTRIQNASSFSGGGVWESTVVASDIAFLRLTRVASGHMQGGTRDIYGGPQQLKQGSTNANAKANYAYQDGSVVRVSFTRSDLSNMVDIFDNGQSFPGGEGGYLLPRARMRQLQ